MVIVAQLVRASDCGSEGRRFEPGQSPKNPETVFRDFLSVISHRSCNFWANPLLISP